MKRENWDEIQLAHFSDAYASQSSQCVHIHKLDALRIEHFFVAARCLSSNASGALKGDAKHNL